MTSDFKPGSFEDFVHWLEIPQGTPERDAGEPPPNVLAAARAAWQAFQSLQQQQRESLVVRIRSGRYYEELEVMAAADADASRWLPRLRTPNGFAISALYAAAAPTGAPPIGLLVECPVELVEACQGQQVHIFAGGQWVEIGELDVDGKATCDLPPGFEFKPPFGFRVGIVEEHPTELGKPDETQ
jgi:hypothetical protein